jgi:hypothetical protein
MCNRNGSSDLDEPKTQGPNQDGVFARKREEAYSKRPPKKHYMENFRSCRMSSQTSRRPG